MISLIIILEVIFLSISGIYYMSLMAYKGQDQLHKKKVVLAVVMCGCSIPGVLTWVTGALQEKEWETGFFYCSLTLLVIAGLWLLFLLRERLRNRLLWEEEGKVSIREEIFQADSVKEPVTRKQVLCLVVLTFVYGILYFDIRSILELMTFVCAIVVLKRNTIKDTMLMFVLSCGIAFILNFVIPFSFG